MESNLRVEHIAEKLNKNIPFGLFEDGTKCYFIDGEHVKYNDLWAAIRLVNNLGKNHNKTLFELCPNTFLGRFTEKFNKNKVKRQKEF